MSTSLVGGSPRGQMTRAAGCAKATAGVVVLLTAVTFETPAGAVPPVAGDQTALQDIAAAFQRLEATSYRMRMTASGQTVITEHVPPDSRRMITRITGQVGEIESITVGNETRSRVIGPGVPGTWLCSDAPLQPPIVLTMKDFGVAVEASRRPDTLGAGAPAHTYELTYTFQRGQTASKTILYINIQTGLPRRSVTSYPLGAGEITSDYYDYGAPITITLPACGETR